MPKSSESDRDVLQRIYAQLGAHLSWANTTDRSARTAPARAALEQKWLDMADGDPERAAQFKAAHYKRVSAAGVAARRRKASS